MIYHLYPVSNVVVSNDDYFSLVPWTSIYIKPDGNAYPCESVGWKGDEFCVGNIKNNTFEEMWNHRVYKEMRLKVINTKTCDVDDKLTIGCTYLQNRSLYNNDLNFYKENTSIDGTFNFNLKRILLERSNICNLTCVYCTPESSTSWASKLKTKSQVRISDDVYWSRLEHILPNLTEINISGGEPTLDPFNEELIDKLIEIKNFIDINLSTNLTYDINKKQTFFTKLTKFPTTIYCSVDATGDTFNTIREGSDWDLVFKNLKILSTFNFKIAFNTVISTLNCFNIKEFHEFLIANKLADIDTIRLVPLMSPEFLSIKSLSNTNKIKLVSYLLNYIIFLKTKEEEKIKTIIFLLI